MSLKNWGGNGIQDTNREFNFQKNRNIPFIYQDCGRVYEYKGREFSGFDGKKMQHFSFDWFYFFFKDRDEITKWEWGEERCWNFEDRGKEVNYSFRE